MILANTKNTGYSLGLPLFWPEHPDQLSTGLVDGISITLEYLTAGTELSITKYAVADGRVSLTISNGAGIVCYLDAQLGTDYAVYSLSGTIPEFLGGWVSMYPPVEERLIDLTGARINPLYVYLCPQTTYARNSFNLYTEEIVSGGLCTGGDTSITPVISGAIISSADLAELVVSDTADVSFTSTLTSGALVVSGTTDNGVTSAQPIDSTNIYTVNGNPISNGGYTINLPEGWVVRAANGSNSGAVCAQIGNTSTETSCPVGDPIVEILGPQNFAGNNPLELAFSTSGGIIEFDPAAVRAARFNAEYEEGSDGFGLRWCEFSEKHDGPTSGGCVDET